MSKSLRRKIRRLENKLTDPKICIKHLENDSEGGENE